MSISCKGLKVKRGSFYKALDWQPLPQFSAVFSFSLHKSQDRITLHTCTHTNTHTCTRKHIDKPSTFHSTCPSSYSSLN
jgi:hypothetical protein